MDELSTEQVAALRSWIRGAVASGHPLSTIDSMLKAKHGVTSADVMKMSGQDFARSMGQGLTLGHLDEAAGLVAKMRGKDYTAARDEVRNNDAESNAANPKMNTAVRMLSGAIPAVAAGAIPGLQPVAGATLANALRGGIQAGGISATDAAGNSTAHSAGGIASDVFSLPTALSAILGGLGGAAASKLADRGLPKGSAGKVTQEGSALLPNKPPNAIRQMVARQEQLAPGTTVAADLSPEIQTMARGVGADLKTAMLATKGAEQRYRSLMQAKQLVGEQYDVLKGQTAPADPEILSAVAATGKKGVIPKSGDVDLFAIHDLRSDLLSKARAAAAAKDAKAAYDLRQQATGLTTWLQKQWSAIKGIDSDYAFLSDRVSAADKTMKILKKSAANYGVNRAFGTESGSVGGSLPGMVLPSGAPGVVLKTVSKVLGSTDRATRARAVADQFLTPLRGTNLLDHMLSVQEILGKPVDHTGLNAAKSALFGGTAVGINQLLAGH